MATSAGLPKMGSVLKIMECKFIKSIEDGYLKTKYYSCPCGKGTIVSEFDSTPGFKDWFTSIECDICNKKYYIAHPDSPNWKIRKIENKEDRKMNIYFLTEEKPKLSTILSILDIYKNDFGVNYTCDNSQEITPMFVGNVFQFSYKVNGITVDGIENIYIKTVSGGSSFLDFLFVVQESEPLEDQPINLVFGVEETKTSGKESRNTNAYQRGTKFIYFRHFYPTTPMYMLYNDELEEDEDGEPTDTEVFGTRIHMTAGVKYVGKKMHDSYRPFTSINELINAKNGMAVPPSPTNVPVRMTRSGNIIYISGTLSKPKDKGNIGHDPNIGCLSMISAALRALGWRGQIIITQSGVKQSYIDRNGVENKFLYVCTILDIGIQGLTLRRYVLPNSYWHYEKNSEKVASILFHIACENLGFNEVYQNHAGCERGYFKAASGKLETLPKYCGNDPFGRIIALKDKNTVATNKRNLLIPDVIMRDDVNRIIYLIEGKQLSTMQIGLNEIEDYDDIEILYINKYFPDYSVKRYLTIYGGLLTSLPHEKVLLYVNNNGLLIMNPSEADLSNRIIRKLTNAIVA